MKQRIQILIVEDDPTDALLMDRELRKGGMNFQSHRVESREQFLRALHEQTPDLILSDHGLPAFDGFSALAIAQEQTPDTPFIFVTGSLGEEMTIKALKSGAADYVLKHQLANLAPAVHRALRQAEERAKRREAETALRRSEERFHLLLQSVKDYAIYMLDPEGRILTWSAGMENIEGYRPEEIVDTHFSSFFLPEEIAAGQPEMELQRAALEGHFESEGWRLRKNGSRFWAHVLITAVRDKTGRLSGFWKILCDRTERKVAEEALQKSEARKSAILQAAVDAIISIDHEGKVEEWNPAAEHMFGYTQAQVLGREMAEIIVPERLRPAHRQHMRGFLSFEQLPSAGRRYELSAVHADGHEFPIELTLARIPIEGPATFTGFIRDLTEQKRAEEQILGLNAELEQRVNRRTAQLEAANKELEAFSYSVSHDLRAPLRHIEGFVEMLQLNAAPALDPECRGFLTTIAGSARRMSKLIDDLLAFSRMARTEMSRSSIDMMVLFELARNELTHNEQGRSVCWSIGPLPSVEGDPVTLRQVVINLLSNALKYTRPRAEARIEVNAYETESETIFCIRDNGVGFDPQYAEKLFRVFQRLHSAGQFEGTGIGLAIVHRIVARHGGRTWAEAQIDGGAAFYFSIPKRGQAEETVDQLLPAQF